MSIQNINLVKGAWRHPSILTSDNVMLPYLKIFKISPVGWDNNQCFTEVVTNLRYWDCVGRDDPADHVAFAVKGVSRLC